MNETEYKTTWHGYNERPCVFSKALLARCVQCATARRLNIAEREAIACTSADAHHQCQSYLDALRQRALFALRITQLDEPLPHGKEIKLQCGGLHGLHDAQQALEGGAVNDVHALLNGTLAQPAALEQLPWQSIIKTIVHYVARKKSTP